MWTPFWKKLLFLKGHPSKGQKALKLTKAGRQAVLLGTGLLAASALFGSTVILLIDACLVLLLAVDEIRFNRTLRTAEYSVKLETDPPNFFVKVDQPLKIIGAITNTSDLEFKIEDVDFDLPVEINKIPQSCAVELPPNGTKSIQLSLIPKVPGRYDLEKVNFNLRSKLGLLTGSASLQIGVTIIATPDLHPGKIAVRPETLEAISTDPIRRGTGTELAGQRPFRYADDIRSINWKATARTGNLIVKESYLERDPPILLLIDVACLTTALAEMTKLLAATELSASSVGLMLYDETKVVAQIQPAAGLVNKKAVLRSMVERTRPSATPPKPRVGVTERPYRSFAEERLALERALFLHGVRPITEKLVVLADFILPFLRSAESKRLQELRGQPVFRAFESASQLKERALVLAVSGGQGNLNGLFEGAVYASRAGHEVIVAILNPKFWSASKEIVPDGIGLINCTAGELLSSLKTTILTMSRRRLNPAALETATPSQGMLPPGSS